MSDATSTEIEKLKARMQALEIFTLSWVMAIDSDRPDLIPVARRIAEAGLGIGHSTYELRVGINVARLFENLP